jgi:hypothetical protein
LVDLGIDVSEEPTNEGGRVIASVELGEVVAYVDTCHSDVSISVLY